MKKMIRYEMTDQYNPFLQRTITRTFPSVEAANSAHDVKTGDLCIINKQLYFHNGDGFVLVTPDIDLTPYVAGTDLATRLSEYATQQQLSTHESNAASTYATKAELTTYATKAGSESLSNKTYIGTNGTISVTGFPLEAGRTNTIESAAYIYNMPDGKTVSIPTSNAITNNQLLTVASYQYLGNKALRSTNVLYDGTLKSKTGYVLTFPDETATLVTSEQVAETYATKTALATVANSVANLPSVAYRKVTVELNSSSFYKTDVAGFKSLLSTPGSHVVSPRVVFCGQMFCPAKITYMGKYQNDDVYNVEESKPQSIGGVFGFITEITLASSGSSVYTCWGVKNTTKSAYESTWYNLSTYSVDVDTTQEISMYNPTVFVAL